MAVTLRDLVQRDQQGLERFPQRRRRGQGQREADQSDVLAMAVEPRVAAKTSGKAQAERERSTATWRAFPRGGTFLVWRRAGGSSDVTTGMVALGSVSDCGPRRVISTST